MGAFHADQERDPAFALRSLRRGWIRVPETASRTPDDALLPYIWRRFTLYPAVFNELFCSSSFCVTFAAEVPARGQRHACAAGTLYGERALHSNQGVCDEGKERRLPKRALPSA